MISLFRSLTFGLGFALLVHIKTKDTMWGFVAGMGIFIITFCIDRTMVILRKEIAEAKIASPPDPKQIVEGFVPD